MSDLNDSVESMKAGKRLSVLKLAFNLHDALHKICLDKYKADPESVYDGDREKFERTYKDITMLCAPVGVVEGFISQIYEENDQNEAHIVWNLYLEKLREVNKNAFETYIHFSQGGQLSEGNHINGQSLCTKFHYLGTTFARLLDGKHDVREDLDHNQAIENLSLLFDPMIKAHTDHAVESYRKANRKKLFGIF